MYDYDMVIVGGGPAGLSAAAMARSLHLRTLLVEKARPGGCSTWTGGVPSMALRHMASIARASRQSGTCGMDQHEGTPDMPHLHQYIRDVREHIFFRQSPEMLESLGTEVSIGTARIRDGHTVTVDETPHTAKTIILATGSRPHIPSIPGLQHTPYMTTDDLWDLESLPKSMAIIGAGFAGCELGQMLALLGVGVTLINRADRLLPSADEDISVYLTECLSDDGVTIRNGCDAQEVDTKGDGVTVRCVGESVDAECLLVAVGRTPAVEQLGLEQAGIAHTADGIEVDRQYRTSVASVYAAGDCIGTPMFTHYARYQGAAAVRSACEQGYEGGIPSNVPWTLHTFPEIAHVGMTESQARDRYGHEVASYYKSMHEVDRATIDGDSGGYLKIIYRNPSTVLGATIAAPRAGELIQEWCNAMEQKDGILAIAGALHAYPSCSQASQDAAEDITREAAGHGKKWNLFDVVRSMRK